MSERLNQQRVDKQLNEKRANFYGAIYTGVVPIPDNIMKVFKSAIFCGVKPQEHQIRISLLRTIISKKPSELTMIEIGSMINVILSTSWDKVYRDFEVALVEHEKIEKFITCYNDLVNKFNSALDKERQTLLSIIQPQSGMKIIAKA